MADITLAGRKFRFILTDTVRNILKPNFFIEGTLANIGNVATVATDDIAYFVEASSGTPSVVQAEAEGEYELGIGTSIPINGAEVAHRGVCAAGKTAVIQWTPSSDRFTQKG